MENKTHAMFARVLPVLYLCDFSDESKGEHRKNGKISFISQWVTFDATFHSQTCVPETCRIPPV